MDSRTRKTASGRRLLRRHPQTPARGPGFRARRSRCGGEAGEARAELARLLHESARHVVPELGDSPIAQTRISDRPIPADGFPSVGALPSTPGYYEAVSHNGITLGPVIGRLLASEILSGRRAAMLADFRPERFPP